MQLLLLVMVVVVVVVVVVLVQVEEEDPPRAESGAPKLVCLRSSDPNTRLPLDSSELLDASDAVLQNGPIRMDGFLTRGVVFWGGGGAGGSEREGGYVVFVHQ